MTIQSDRLPDGKHREILNDILEYKLESATSQKNPRAVIIAGQPGSGKSRITIKAMEEFDRNVIVIDPDKLRSNHPNYKKHLIQNDKTAAQMAHTDASLWAKELRSAAIKEHKNLIIDGTLGNPRNAQKLAEELKKNGYVTDVRALAVSREQSIQGIRTRYENAKQKYISKDKATDSMRWVPDEVHDKAYEKMPSSVEMLEKRKLVDKVSVIGRKDNRTSVLYSNDIKNGIAMKGKNARDVIESERNRPMTKDEKATYNKRWDTVKKMMDKRSADKSEIRDVDRRIKIDRIRIERSANTKTENKNTRTVARNTGTGSRSVSTTKGRSR